MRWSHWIAALTFALLSSRAAFADDSTLGCIDANADAQRLEHDGKLRDARAKLVSCANASCPAAVRSDCASILERVEAEQPTLTIDVRDESGTRTTRASISVDGAIVPDAASGRAFPVDPGEHTLRAALGGQTRDVQVVAVQGEKDHRVLLEFYALHGPPTQPVSTRFVVPWLAWTFAGASALSFGAFVYFGVTGNGIKNRLDTTCRATTTCSPSEYSNMATSYTAADVFAAVAGGTLVLAVVTAIAWPRGKRAAIAFSIDGAGASLHGTF